MLARLNKRKPADSLVGLLGVFRYCKKDRLKTEIFIVAKHCGLPQMPWLPINGNY